jgi:hypothetical protein
MPIKINKEQDNLFISIAKIKAHTFIMLGVYNSTKVKHLLCRVGKVLDGGLDELNCLERVFFSLNILASEVPGKLDNEIIEGDEKREDQISYQAYDISLKQYIAFIRLLEAMETEHNRYLCYKPVDEDETEITFISTDEPVFVKASNISPVMAAAHGLSVTNTCRHTAINVLEEVLKVPKPSLVSTHFFNELPYQTKLDYCKPSDEIPFYVLPISPVAFPNLPKEKHLVLTKLYQRMENMLLIEPNSIQTQAKFLALKSYYNETLGNQNELSIEELLNSIQSWKETNKSTLSVLRKTYFWDEFVSRESETMKMVSGIEETLQQGMKLV